MLLTCPPKRAQEQTPNTNTTHIAQDTSNPGTPKVLATLDLGSNAKPHYITPLGPGDNRFAIADYFLDRAPFITYPSSSHCYLFYVLLFGSNTAVAIADNVPGCTFPSQSLLAACTLAPASLQCATPPHQIEAIAVAGPPDSDDLLSCS